MSRAWPGLHPPPLAPVPPTRSQRATKKPPGDDTEKPAEPEPGPDGTTPQVKKPESKGEQPNPGQKPGGVKRPLSYTPAAPKSLDMETALARAEACASCAPRKTGPYAGQKGCTRCMGQHFETVWKRGFEARALKDALKP